MSVRTTFSSLSVRNYRIYFGGQIVSIAGTWMQTIAQVMLVVKLTDSATTLGLVIATQMLPVLLFGLWAGVIADRVNRRMLLIVTQMLGAACALVLGTLVATGTVRLWMVFGLAAVLGLVQAFENPARGAFVSELVQRESLANAIGLNSVMMNLARIVGPGTAGLVNATLGLAACFFFNAVSFFAVVGALLLIRPSELVPHHRTATQARLMDGLRYVRSTPIVLVPLVLMGIVGTIAYNFQITLPTLANRAFDNEDLYGTMSALQGAGAVVGALAVASRFKAKRPELIATMAVALGITIFAVVAAPSLAATLAVLVVLGAVSMALIAIANTILQLGSHDSMRGRVMSLWSIALIGSTTVGGPFIGWFSDRYGPRAGLGLGGVTAIVAGVIAFPMLRRLGADAVEPVAPIEPGLSTLDVEVAPAV